MNNDVFASRLKSRRQYLGLSLEDLASKIGVSKSTVLRWETGYIANVKRDKIVKLSEALNVSAAWLMGWTEDVASKKEVAPSKKDEASKMFNSLSPEEQEQALNYIRFLLSSRK